MGGLALKFRFFIFLCCATGRGHNAVVDCDWEERGDLTADGSEGFSESEGTYVQVGDTGLGRRFKGAVAVQHGAICDHLTSRHASQTPAGASQWVPHSAGHAPRTSGRVVLTAAGGQCGAELVCALMNHDAGVNVDCE